ncbi:hypothetical protein MMC22_005684 [Lobaria immixta]|nr:hypothetical protein [Lobaria immixta]
MAESSAKGAAKPFKSKDKPITSSSKGGTSRRHLSERLKSLLRNRSPHPASLQTSSTSSPDAVLATEEGGDGEIPSSGLGLASGKRPESSSAARSISSTAQVSHSTPDNGNTSAGVDRDCEAAGPIAELWNQAYEQLREKEPKLIEKYEEEISLHVSTMVGATVALSGLGKVRRREQMEILVKQKLKEDEDGRWRIPLGNDRIAIRDLAGYIVSIVDWGKEFVGTALESSPYGSIAWTGVCLLLPLILNPSKERGSNICGLEYISDLLSRCTMYEHAYHQRYEVDHDGRLSYDKLDLTPDGYKSALKELYIRILRFQARTICQLSRNTVSGGIRAMFKMDDWDSLLGDIKVQEASCQTFFDLVKDQEALDAREEGHRQRTLLLLDKLEDLSLGIKGIQNKLDEIHISDEESKCFETLRTSDYVGRKDLNPEPVPGTCKWFLDHPKYKDWMDQTSASRLLSVSANPGCGKSVLAKALVDQYDRGSVCYYFFKDDTLITRSAAHAVCAILHQICSSRPDFIKYALPLHRKNRGKLIDSLEDLWSIFVDIVNDNDFENVICILDAVDECSDDDQKKLLQKVAAIATSSTSIKILITSRPWKSIETALFYQTGLDKKEICLSGEAKMEQSMIEKEIGFFITFKVQEFQKLRESSGMYDNAHEKLQNHLDGVINRTYLWVSAVFNELERDKDAPEYILMETIQALPENVDKAYENILKRRPKAKKHTLIKVLHVMLAAFRPLSLIEMNMVLAIQDRSSDPRYSGLHSEDSFGKWLRDLCGFFIIIVDDKLYFAHQTAREFLIQEDSYHETAVEWKGSFQLADSHTLLARVCIDYLLLLYDGSLDATFQTYATSYWPSHCQSFEVDQSLANKVKSFLFQSSITAPSFVRWTMAMNHFLEYDRNRNLSSGKMVSISPPPTPLFLACDFGWPSAILVLKTSPDMDWNKRNKFGQTGLHIATQKGHLKIVKLLLNAKADVNILEPHVGTALHLATSQGYHEIVQLLLAAEAEVDIQNGAKVTALHLAVEKNHLEIVKLLLMAGAAVNTQDYMKRAALHGAVTKGHLEIVKLLLAARADVNTKSDEGTALCLAASRGHLEIVKLLLNTSAEVDTQVCYGGKTALHQAVVKGYPKIVKLLLTAGADINKTSDYGTALWLAVFQGHLGIVKLLLTAGADPNTKGAEGTALYLALSRGHLEIVKLLLTAGADVKTEIDQGPVVYLAVPEGHLDNMKAIVRKEIHASWIDAYNQNTRDGTVLYQGLPAGYFDPDTSIRNLQSGTVLYQAVSRGHPEIVKLLLTAGADVNAQGFFEGKALQRAVMNAHLETEAFTDGGSRYFYEATALHYAASEGHLEIVRLLLTAGADINAQSHNKWALQQAVMNEHLKCMKLSLMAGANVNSQNLWEEILEIERPETMEPLLTAGLDASAQYRKEETALHSAVLRGHLEIVKLLLAAGADVNIQNSWGETALHQTVGKGNLEIVQLLLTAEANVNIQASIKTTSLDQAMLDDQREISKLLLGSSSDINMDSGNAIDLECAVNKGHLEIVELFLTVGADINAQDHQKRSAYQKSFMSLHLAAVRDILRVGADFCAFDHYAGTALHRAVTGGHLEVLKLLLTADAEINAQDHHKRSVLHQAIAVGKGRPDIVKLLLSAGADFRYLEILKLLLTAGAVVHAQDCKGWTVLRYAILQGRFEIVKLLLAAGADVGAQDRNEATALHWAASTGYLEIVKLLLTTGADVHAQDCKGWTALRYAILEGHFEIVKLLLAAGADINARDHQKRSGLRYAVAVSKGHPKIVNLFLTAGADVNAQDRFEATALHWAVSKGYLEIVKALLAAGADVNVESVEGTPLHIAIEEGKNVEILETLLAAGAGESVKSTPNPDSSDVEIDSVLEPDNDSLWMESDTYLPSESAIN